MLKVLTFSSLFPSPARPGHGLFVAARLRELCQRHPVQARVIAPVPWFPSRNPRYGAYAQYAATPLRTEWEGRTVAYPRYAMLPRIGMGLQPMAMARASLKLIRQWQREGWDFDLIDAHYFYPDGVAAAWLARQLGKPLVISARGSDLNLIGGMPGPRARMLAAAGQAQACIGVSAALVEVLRGWGLPESKLHVLRNGVDLSAFAPLERAQARAQLGLEGAGPWVLSVGNLLELKGQHLLIEAVAALRSSWPGLRLLLIGQGPERERLEAQVHSLGLQDQVRLVGAVPNAELAPWYAAADLKVLASSREGMANVLLEALACGTPVLATAVGGSPEVVSDPAVGALLAERSASALAASLDTQLRRGFDRAAIRRHAEGFSWQQTCARLYPLLLDSAQGSAAHA